jgi:serine/threonine protein kinase/formylglycine-generating enzyme required for sulfatase activity
MQKNKGRPEPTIPDHEVLRKIGGGAYGEVWLARAVTGALRAVKTVWHNDFDDERGFEREFEGILKYEPISRDHPGLVHILHVGRAQEDGEPFYYYVMELGDDVTTGREINTVEYEPRTLRSDMKAAEGAALDAEDCISAGRMLAEALEHLHQHGLAHRDVKPSNVIFVDGKAKLADIGLVALRGQQTFVGTEGFVPPEGPGSAQADVYSLGKVLYEMATGKDRLDFPELPDELPRGTKLKRWRCLNSIVCDVCEPKISRRKIKSAGELALELVLLENGRRRPVRVRPGVIVGILAAAIGVGGGAQMINWKPLEVPSHLGPVKPVDTERVSINSFPDDAEVYSEEGKLLGSTPLMVGEFPVGSQVTFTLKKRNHRDQTIEGEVTPKGLVLIPNLTKYQPPIELEPWEDVHGTRYQPVESHHVSQYYVTADAWGYYLEATNKKVGHTVTLTENGMMNEVVLATPQEARGYAKWLERECRETHLDEAHWFVAKSDRTRVMPEVNPEWLKRNVRPFWCVVRKETIARIKLASKPTGADVYIQRMMQGEMVSEYLGVTPLLGELVEGSEEWEGHKVTLGPKGGNVKLILELPKFKRSEVALTLDPNEVMKEALFVRLERENIFDFNREPLENSLEMQLIPVRPDLELLVGVWETRNRDYTHFVQAVQKKVLVSKTKDKKERANLDYAKFVNSQVGKVLPPLPPDFAIAAPHPGPSHPVVNVTREHAAMFCEWLTLFERKNKEIGAGLEYRLPTDSEWSILVGLGAEVGVWPMEKHGNGQAFLWGGGFPPPPKLGNFADDALIGSGFAPPGDQISGYDDSEPFTAPVGQFEGRFLGRAKIYDLEGNVLEWVSDDYSGFGEYNVARGASWKTYRHAHMKASARTPVRKVNPVEGVPDTSGLYGFRVVLAKVPVITEKEADEALPAPKK